MKKVVLFLMLIALMGLTVVFMACGNNSGNSNDNPMPVNPTPVVPDDPTPVIPVPTEYRVNGKIDGEKYGIASGDITATASNGRSVVINNDYTYSVFAQSGSLTLKFSVENFGEIEDTFYVSGDVVKNYAFDEPALTINTASFYKTEGAKNRYEVNIDNGIPYNCAAFEWVRTKYFVIESDVSIINTGTSGDFGVGFIVGSGSLSAQYVAPYIGTDCGILISKKGNEKWKVEMVYFDENGTIKRDAVNADFDSYNYMHPSWRIEAESDISSDMNAAMQTGGRVRLKAVRSDKLIAIFVNDKYAGSFITEQYEGQRIASSSSEDYIGLYERGGVQCVFDNVNFDLRKSVADAAIATASPKKGTVNMQTWGGMLLDNGTNTTSNGTLNNVTTVKSIANNSGIVAAGITGVNAKYWILEATISEVITHTDWNGFYIGFMVNGWRTSCFNMYHVNASWGEQSFCLEGVSGNPWSQNFVPDANYTRNVNLQNKYTDLFNGGSLVYKIVRAGDYFYIFIDGKLVATATVAQLGFSDSAEIHPASNSIGFSARAFTQATFSNISYYTDGIAVYNALKDIRK